MRLANNLLNTEIIKAGTFTILVSLTLGGVGLEFLIQAKHTPFDKEVNRSSSYTQKPNPAWSQAFCGMF